MNPFEVDLIVVEGAERGVLDPRSLSRDVAAGRRLRLRRGVYVSCADWDALDDVGKHILRIRALQAVTRRRLVFSHESALALHRIPTLEPLDALMHTTHPTLADQGQQGVRTHRLALLGDEVLEWNGLLLTSLARTAVDVAAARSFEAAVVVADATLDRLERAGHAGSSSKDLLRAAADRAQPRRAARKVEAVIDFADGRAQTPLESVSRVTMRTLGVPRPELQHRFIDEDGFAGDVDFWFEAERVAGESDGKLKYMDPKITKGDPAAVVYAEKVREDRIRRLGVRFARWDWSTGRSSVRLGRVLAAVGVVPRR